MKKIILALFLLVSFSAHAELVSMNTKTMKYHEPSCKWAQKCKNCTMMEENQAIRRGGVPCKICLKNHTHYEPQPQIIKEKTVYIKEVPVEKVVEKEHTLTANEILIQKVQAHLTGLGYYKDSVDGTITQDLRKSIVQYQIHNGLDADGLVSKSLLEHMKQTSKSVSSSLDKAKVRVNRKPDSSFPSWLNLYLADGIVSQPDSKYRNYVGEGINEEMAYQDMQRQLKNDYFKLNPSKVNAVKCERSSIKSVDGQTFCLYRCLKKDIEE